jgi:hypothetical protein
MLARLKMRSLIKSWMVSARVLLHDASLLTICLSAVTKVTLVGPVGVGRNKFNFEVT